MFLSAKYAQTYSTNQIISLSFFPNAVILSATSAWKCTFKKVRTNTFSVPKTRQLFKKTYENYKLKEFPINKEIELILNLQDMKLCKTHDKPLEYYCETDNA